MRSSVIPCLAAAVLASGACSDEPAGGAAEALDETVPSDEAMGALVGRTFERSLALVATGRDSLVIVPWLLTAGVSPGGVDRGARGLVLGGTEWQTVFEDDWEDPPTRAPWRILPRDGMRLVAGMDDALERIVYDDGVRQLELVLGETLTEWSGPRGGSYRLLQGSAVVAGRTVDGLMLDIRRSVGPDESPYGDWAFLISGDSLQVLLHSPRRQTPGGGTGRPPGDPGSEGGGEAGSGGR